ncbi:MAG: hypothetical protein ACRCWI_08125 [Brevinema sp.]
MKYLLIVLLIIGGWADNKAQTVARKELITESILKAPIEVSYDKGLDLILVDITSFEAAYWDSNNNIYYISTQNTYIPVSKNNFLYTVDNDKQKEPTLYPDIPELFSDTVPLLPYLGSISPLERVYLDPIKQRYHIKTLTSVNTSIYTEYIGSKGYITNINPSPIYPITITNYYYHECSNGVYSDRDVIQTAFTNTNDQMFRLSFYFLTLLLMY